MDRSKPAFFDELGKHSSLMCISTAKESIDLPWSLLPVLNCDDEQWPPNALPMISSLTAEDALEQMQFVSERWGMVGAHISVVVQDGFLDAEGALEAARLFIDADFFPIIRSPLEWSTATRLSEVGCLAVDIAAIRQGEEDSVSRPWLLERILRDATAPVLLSGPFCSGGGNLWLSKGASAIVQEGLL